MQLTNEMLISFVGGDVEIEDDPQGHLCRGPIKNVVIEEGHLEFTFEWLALRPLKFVNLHLQPWIKDARTGYTVDVSDCMATENINGLLYIKRKSGRMVVLFQPDGDKLDPKRVEGLSI